MKAWFGCTTSKFNKYKKYYYKITQHLKDEGILILNDWLKYADDDIQKGVQKDRDVKKLFKIVTHAIDIADFSIVEYTVPNFSSSYQIHYAIQIKKPVLVLRLKLDNENYHDSFIDGIDSKYLTVKSYTLGNYKTIINDFIKYNLNDNSQNRYNVVLGKKQNSYLEWASIKYKKSKSSIIRDSVDSILEKDKNYTS